MEDLGNADVLQELTCTVCFDLYYEPTTLRCGHTFCSECIQKSISRKKECPICREVNICLPKPSVILRNICKHHFPKQYEERNSIAKKQISDSKMLPLFILEPLVPFQETTLYIFEHRYRNMINQCLETGMLFGVRDNTETRFGVEVGITRYMPQSNGRSIVKIKSLRRFEIEEIRTHHDGYPEARVMTIRDLQETIDREALSNLRYEISQKLIEWIALAKQKRGESRVSKILRNLGQMPQDFEDHSFWVAALLNPVPNLDVCKDIRSEALEMKNTRQRYELIRRTIENSMRYMEDLHPAIGPKGIIDWPTYIVVCIISLIIFTMWMLGSIFPSIPSVSEQLWMLWQVLWDLLALLIRSDNGYIMSDV